MYSGDSTSELRGRALLLYGFAGALHRSEIVRIDREHISSHEKGHLLTIPFSKGDQTGRGQTIGILAQPASPYCPVSAIQQWLLRTDIKSGPVFRRLFRGGKVSDDRLGDRTVAEVIKDAIFRLKDPSLDYQHFSGHSLRRGFQALVKTKQIYSNLSRNHDILKSIQYWPTPKTQIVLSGTPQRPF